MSNFPNSIDTDIEIPRVDDDIAEIGSDAINAIRSAIFAVEANIGTNANGTMDSISDRLNVSIDATGVMKPSAIIGIGIGLISDTHISSSAGIAESKLNLAYTTDFLYDLFNNAFISFNNRADILEGFVSTTGAKVEPHIAGTAFRHALSHIDVDTGTLNRVNILVGATSLRNLTNSYTFLSELSDDFLKHTRADKLSNTTTPPANQAHNASGIYINPNNFVSVPQTANDLQTFADFVDSSSLVLLGSRTQNLFSNGLPRTSRSYSLTNVQAGEAIVDPTMATTYLLYGSAIAPVDDLDHGDDVIMLNPADEVLSNNNFDAQFSQVKSGDYVTINYGNGSVPVRFVVDSAKKFLDGTNRVYTIRINGKNLYASTNATIRIDRPFFHDTKFNSLSLAAAHNQFDEIPSLITSNPAGAVALGIGFNPTHLNTTHFNLYLELYPTGNPIEKTIVMPVVDVTADTGISSAKYTLDKIVENINDRFRSPGFNTRFVAFAYQGRVGIALADRYNDASFSIIGGVVDGYGNYTSSSNADYLNNVVDNYHIIDALGFGIAAANIASPPFETSYSTANSALVSPTTIFAPLRKNFYYVDGVERDTFSKEIFTTEDGYGDGYWLAILTTRQILSGHVEATYEIDLDLSTSGLKKGKTLVVQPAVDIDSASYKTVDYGRFIIKNVVFNNCPGTSGTTTLTVYDAIHAVGSSPASSSSNLPVYIYFSDDSVSFNIDHVSDPSVHSSFKRFFEVYIDTNGDSFTHERARFNVSGSNLVVDSINSFTLYSPPAMSIINLIDISPKLRGYTFGQYKKISLYLTSYNAATGIFIGYLCKYEFPSDFTQLGPTVSGKKGEVVRFYDITTVDYVDILIPLDVTIASDFFNTVLDIQLYPSLQLNQEKILIGTCQLDQPNKRIEFIKDKRQFGNTSEKNLSTSAIDFITAPQRLLDENGVIQGFDLISSGATVSIRGGSALVNGKVVEFNDNSMLVPLVQEKNQQVLFDDTVGPTGTYTNRWYLCGNSTGDYEFVVSTDYSVENASLYGPFNHNRIFYVYNYPDNASSYPIKSTYFSKLLKTKDLIPLYVVTATFDEGAVNVSVADCRRYVSNGYHGLSEAFILGRNASFRNVESVQTYIGELTNYISFTSDGYNNFGQTVYVRDTFDISNINFIKTPAKVSYVGDGGRFQVTDSDTFPDANNVFGNISFINLTIDVSSSMGFFLKGENITFDGCTINYNYDGTSTMNVGQLGNIDGACIYAVDNYFTGKPKNIFIKNCTFNTPFNNHYPFISLILSEGDRYYENVQITGNYFNNTVSDADDKRCVVALTCTDTVTPSSKIGPRLINCSISNNICNKNQLIMMSGNTNGDGNVANMCVPINTHIDNNICGAICYLTRQDKTYSLSNLNTFNGGTIIDKQNMLFISGNTCRFIYCGTNKGFVNVIGTSNRIFEIPFILADWDIYSSSVIMTNNTCSWVHVGVKNPTSYAFQTPLFVFENNNLNAYDSSFLDDYYSVMTPSNIGLIIDSIEGT